MYATLGDLVLPIPILLRNARAQTGHENITRMIYFVDFCELKITTTRQKSLPFASLVDWESLGKLGGKDVCNKCSQLFLIVLLICNQ